VAAFCHKNKLYVIKDGSNVFVYDPAGLQQQWSPALVHVTFPSGMEFNYAVAYKDHVYLTIRHGLQVYRCPLIQITEDKCQLETVGEFEFETQNVCLVDSVIYNFSSDQYDFCSTLETFDLETSAFDLVFKTESEELDFSPYYSFGCFPLIKYPNYSL
jgi:hypothetical protein